MPAPLLLQPAESTQKSFPEFSENKFKQFLMVIIRILGLLLLSVGGVSCGEDSDVPEGATSPMPQIIVMYAPGGLGDQGYIDQILAGMQTFKKDHHEDAAMYQYSPTSMEEAERLLTDWLSLPESDIPALFIAASSDYEELVESCVTRFPLTSNKRMLMFESGNGKKLPVTTFHLSMYGSSYLSGVAAATCLKDREGELKDVLIMLAYPGDAIIANAARGFEDGYRSVSAETKICTEYLAEDWSGYVSPQEAYHKMAEWSKKYAYIYPVAGGSNHGIYRYTRENSESPLTAGMDVDQSGLSRNITGSVIKNIDRVICRYLETWLTTGDLPESNTYGLESGYTDFVLSPHFVQYQPIVDAKRAEAIRKENLDI